MVFELFSYVGVDQAGVAVDDGRTGWLFLSGPVVIVKGADGTNGDE